MKLLDRRVALALILLRNFYSDFPVLCQPLPHIFASTCYFLSLWWWLTEWCETMSRVWFSFTFSLIISDVEHFFSCAHWPLVYLLGKMSMWFLFTFSIKLFFLIKERVMGVLYMFWLLSFYLQYDLQIFSPIPYAWLFILLTVLFSFSYAATFSKRKESQRSEWK